MTTTLEQTATTADEAPSTTRMFVWFGQPDLGGGHVLAVSIGTPDNATALRPLMFFDVDQAVRHRGYAEQAAQDLGLKLELREYEFVSLLDRVDPADGVTP